MILRRFYDDMLAQASFLVGCSATGEALVIDPNRDTDQYLQAAEEEGLRITAVTETHIHADFVSGSRDLARRTGAQIHLSGEGGPDWQYTFASEDVAKLLSDGSEIRIGNVVVRAMHTPGHTPEHLSFILIDEPASDQPMGVFTGDCVFIGDVGRPDLLETAAGVKDTMQAGAETLFRSIQRFRELPPEVILWPGHGAGSPCGKSLGGTPETTLGYEQRANWAFRASSSASFVAEVLSDQPEPPRYFADMKRINKEGPGPADGLGNPPRQAVSKLFDVLDSNAIVVDLRPRGWVEAQAVDRAVALSIADRSFLMWAGSLVTPEDTVYFIARDLDEARLAARGLAKIGLERVAGWFQTQATLSALEDAGRLRPLPSISAADFVRDGRSGALMALDVRTQGERGEAKLDFARHMPMARLQLRRQELPKDVPLGVHCHAGTRAMVATSYLLRQGFDARAVREDFDTLERVARETTESEAGVR